MTPVMNTLNSRQQFCIGFLIFSFWQLQRKKTSDSTVSCMPRSHELYVYEIEFQLLNDTKVLQKISLTWKESDLVVACTPLKIFLRLVYKLIFTEWIRCGRHSFEVREHNVECVTVECTRTMYSYNVLVQCTRTMYSYKHISRFCTIRVFFILCGAHALYLLIIPSQLINPFVTYIYRTVRSSKVTSVCRKPKLKSFKVWSVIGLNR